MIQVYTGNGKGKTTAALGLALRAAGANLKVYIGQFAKGCHYSELNSLAKIKNIKLEQFGSRCFIGKTPTGKDRALANKGFEKIRKIIFDKKYDVVILDEINIAVHFKLLDSEEVINLIRRVPKDIELILTGRYAHPKILKLADLISEIKEIRHYYKKGTTARKGIEI